MRTRKKSDKGERSMPVIPAQQRENEFQWPEEIINNFDIQRLLGQGGMGRVYLLRGKATWRQFAVKRAIGVKDADRDRIFRELQIWQEIPEHVNLVPCRFFRTYGDTVLIFSDYVPGGTLEEIIGSGKLYEGGEKQALARMLDISIQLGWSVACLHALGLIHQDIKPLNVLIDDETQKDGRLFTVKLADFGISRMCAVLGTNREVSDNIVACGGRGTPAYAPPEQAGGELLTHHADMWTWGLTILQMFQGGVQWTRASDESAILESLARAKRPGIPALAEDIGTILKGCFKQKPEQRWATMSQVVEMLRAAYENALKTEYTTELPPIEKLEQKWQGDSTDIFKSRRWDDPGEYLKKALLAQRGSTAEAQEILSRQANSRRGNLALDIEIYSRALGIYEDLIGQGHENFVPELIELCWQASHVHYAAGNSSGQVEMYDRAIRTLEPLLPGKNRLVVIWWLSKLYRNKIATLMDNHRERKAEECCEHAVRICELAQGSGQWTNVSRQLAVIYSIKGILLANSGQERFSVEWFDKAISLCKEQLALQGDSAFERELALATLNKASCLNNQIGEKKKALTIMLEVLPVMERLASSVGPVTDKCDLAALYNNIATIRSGLGEHKAALQMYGKAIDLLEASSPPKEAKYTERLGEFYVNKAALLVDMGQRDSAIQFFDKAIKLFDSGVNNYGQVQLGLGLARGLYGKAGCLLQAKDGDRPLAILLLNRALVILEHLNKNGQEGVLPALTAVRKELAKTTPDLGGSAAAKGSIVRVGRRVLSWVLSGLDESIRFRFMMDGSAVVLTLSWKAAIYKKLGDIHAAIKMYDLAISTGKGLLNSGKEEEGLSALIVDAIVKKSDVAMDYKPDLALIAQLVSNYDSAIKFTEAEIPRFDNLPISLSQLRNCRIAEPKWLPAKLYLLHRVFAYLFVKLAWALLSIGITVATFLGTVVKNFYAKKLAKLYAGKAKVAAQLGEKKVAIAAYQYAIEKYRSIGKKYSKEIARLSSEKAFLEGKHWTYIS